MMNTTIGGATGVNAEGQAVSGGKASARAKITHKYLFEAFDPQGNLKWSEEIDNIVVNTGLDDILDKYYKGSAYTAAHYVLLTDGTPTTAAGDTMASHAGWTEVTAYSQAARPAYTPGTVSGQSVDNSASKATYTISADNTTIGGAGLTTDDTKGGTTGTLVSVAGFTGGNKVLGTNDTLNVTVTATMADNA